MIYIPKTQEEKEGIAKWMAERLGERYPEIFETIAVIKDSKLVGGMIFYDYFGHSISLGIVLDTPKCVTRNLIRVLLGYPFRQLKCNRISAYIRKSNDKSRRFAEGLGFILEGTLRNYTEKGEDMCVYGLIKDDFMRGKYHESG